MLETLKVFSIVIVHMSNVGFENLALIFTLKNKETTKEQTNKQMYSQIQITEWRSPVGKGCRGKTKRVKGIRYMVTEGD